MVGRRVSLGLEVAVGDSKKETSIGVTVVLTSDGIRDDSRAILLALGGVRNCANSLVFVVNVELSDSNIS